MYTRRFKTHHDAYKVLKKRFETAEAKEAYVGALLSKPPASKRVIYIHVPFCNKRCSFCPFFRSGSVSRDDYDSFIVEEIKRKSSFPYMRAAVDAVYIGGGTPTALKNVQMERILRTLRENFVIPEGNEISVETSITELSDEMTRILLENGVNRLSIGVQTFDDKGRELLGRSGSGEAAVERIRKTLKAGFQNVGIDLLYNWPGQTPESLKRDLDIIRSLGLSGVSFYSMLLHEHTPLAGMLSQEERERMLDTEYDRQLFDMIFDNLHEDGYRPFELTKLIRNGQDRYDYIRIRHTGGSCIAIGKGAGGNLERYSYMNGDGDAVLSAEVPFSSKGRVLDSTYYVFDEFIHDLQKMRVDIKAYSERMSVDLKERFAPVLSRLEGEGLLTVEGDTISLTKSGIFWGNNVADELIRCIL